MSRKRVGRQVSRVAQVIRWLVAPEQMPAAGTAAFLTADVNRDGRLTLADFLCLLRGVAAGGTLPC